MAKATPTTIAPPAPSLTAAREAPLEGLLDADAEADAAEPEPDAVRLAPAPLTVPIPELIVLDDIVVEAEDIVDVDDAASAVVEDEGNEGVVDTPY